MPRSRMIDLVRGEIAACAYANRIISVEPYTLDRWARITGNPAIASLAKKNRVVRVQPYTFDLWLQQIGGSKAR